VVVLATTDIEAAVSLPADFESLAEAISNSEHHMVFGRGIARLRLCLRPVPSMCPECLIILHDQSTAIRLAAAARFDRAIHSDRLMPDRKFMPSAYQRARHTQLLQVHDTLEAGASSRDLAFGLVFRGHRPLVGAIWKGSGERRHVLRLIAEARRMVDGGYRKLLRHE
jgi:hypothetical protein